ncbi:MAG TPA: sulfotransferase, partial [Gammaproteobacteria bacterium]|nr:sulfotransferase [Gammaproteobacteria bacterium]
LTEQILSAHPEIAGGDELLYFASIRKLLPSLLKRDEAYPLCCPFLDSQNAEDIIRHYLALLERHSETARFVTDKLPDNYLYLGLIRVLFPNAPIIHCRRNPLDVCLSNYFQSFHTGLDYSFDLMDTGHHYLQYSRLMAHWRRVLPGAFLEIRYEDLVTDLEKNGRKLIEFCGLEWHEDCLQFHEQKRDIRTASFWQVRQPIYKSSVGRWKNYESQLEPLMQLFAQAEDEL